MVIIPLNTRVGPNRLLGFTLIELMITIAIASILLALAIPGFREIIQNNRAATVTSQFTSALQLARSEAVKRGHPVSMCAASTTAQIACGAATDWDNGWIVFDDPDGNGVLAALGDRINIVQAPGGDAVVNTGISTVVFSQEGFTTIGTGNITVSAAGCTGNHGRQLSISNTGRVSITQAPCP